VNAKEVTRDALEEAAALVEYLRARIEERRDELDSAHITWGDATMARRMAEDLLLIAAAPHYDAQTPEAVVQFRVLTEARERFFRSEGREVTALVTMRDTIPPQ
jgi:hypothetical protein